MRLMLWIVGGGNDGCGRTLLMGRFLVELVVD